MRLTTIALIFAVAYALFGCGASPAAKGGGSGGAPGTLPLAGSTTNTQPASGGAAGNSPTPGAGNSSNPNAPGQAGASSNTGTGGVAAVGAAAMRGASSGGTRGGAGGSTIMSGSGGVSGGSADAGIDWGGIADAGDVDASVPPGSPDPNGPCADLNLVCFDIFDMWVNPECQTCNGGQGCQGCAIPFAY